ncbi:Apc13p protein-domain-containing protein [Apiospora saccharicola]|uniref:Apc13p protein-domain-containing protein n=1 Tax=Apiospora saccharicola TaxID=335842 RepID=A0ABR1TM55_9PEZI
MNKDGHYTQVHMTRARDADLFDDFTHDQLPADDIYVPPQHQPINPEDEDDVVPDQHAAFGIAKATQKQREPAWRDLGLHELMNKGPSAARVGKGSAIMTGSGGFGSGAASAGGGGGGRGLPR